MLPRDFTALQKVSAGAEKAFDVGCSWQRDLKVRSALPLCLSQKVHGP
jgi:hypothetical protein